MNQVKRVTSIDVARLAGVSQSSVSRVFSPNANVSEEKRKRILEAARHLGYKPNALARSLITQSTNLIGVVVSDLSSLFYAHFISLLTRHLRQIGKQAILFNVGMDEPADEVLPTLLEYQVDALLIASTTLSADMATESTRLGTPVILFNRITELPQVSSVCVDNYRGGREIARLFIDSGHRRLAFVAGIAGTQTSALRQKGFYDYAAAAGFEPLAEDRGDYTYQSGFEAAVRLLDRPEPPDAIFFASDQMALGAIDAARARGIRVPEDLSIAGFDNIPQGAWDGYQLTTIAQPLNVLLDATIQVLADQLAEGSFYRGKNTLIPGELIIRHSVRLQKAA